MPESNLNWPTEHCVPSVGTLTTFCYLVRWQKRPIMLSSDETFSLSWTKLYVLSGVCRLVGRLVSAWSNCFKELEFKSSTCTALGQIENKTTEYVPNFHPFAGLNLIAPENWNQHQNPSQIQELLVLSIPNSRFSSHWIQSKDKHIVQLPMVKITNSAFFVLAQTLPEIEVKNESKGQSNA
jgi:hypothetical protein